MLSSVFLSGNVGEKVDETHRYVEVDRLMPNVLGEYVTDRFVVNVKSERGGSSAFMNAPLGSFVCVKGRLENDRKYGMVIVEEISEVYRMPKGMNKTKS